MLKKVSLGAVTLLVTASLANATLTFELNSATQVALASDTNLGYSLSFVCGCDDRFRKSIF
jgi:hypothetical protein